MYWILVFYSQRHKFLSLDMERNWYLIKGNRTRFAYASQTGERIIRTSKVLKPLGFIPVGLFLTFDFLLTWQPTLSQLIPSCSQKSCFHCFIGKFEAWVQLAFLANFSTKPEKLSLLKAISYEYFRWRYFRWRIGYKALAVCRVGYQLSVSEWFTLTLAQVNFS